VLLLHELHEVVGESEDAFEAAYREHLMPALAETNDARLLYFLHHAVGTGPSYNVVTITAVRDHAAFGRVAERFERGDLRDFAIALDDVRHDVRAKSLAPLPWSPLQDIDLESVPTDGREHALSLFMEDTVWPYEGGLEEYIDAAGAHYASEMEERKREGISLLQIEASFRTSFASHLRREIVLWQKVVNPKALVGLLSNEVPARFKEPGLWMHDALAVRDRWQSRLLRTTRWSPWH
jgi:hypothetical protein